jgi:hypothetical protein
VLGAHEHVERLRFQGVEQRTARIHMHDVLHAELLQQSCRRQASLDM